MSSRRIIPALLGGLLLPATASTLQAADRPSADLDAFDRQWARISALDAISQAELYTMGDILDVRFEVRDGRPDYLVHAVKDGQLMTVLVDASMGIANSPIALDEKPGLPLTDERTAAAAMPHSNTRFDDAIGAAERRLHGSAFGARLALRDGKPTVEVDIVRDAALYTATVDPTLNLEGSVAERR
jgi:uncharacterized membrane protein YkoI